MEQNRSVVGLEDRVKQLGIGYADAGVGVSDTGRSASDPVEGERGVGGLGRQPAQAEDVRELQRTIFGAEGGGGERRQA